MAEEDERYLALPEWEQQQVTAFTRWVSYKVRQLLHVYGIWLWGDAKGAG